MKFGIKHLVLLWGIYLPSLLFFVLAGISYGADTKGSALSTVTPLATDKVYLIDDPDGTPGSATSTVQALITAILGTNYDGSLKLDALFAAETDDQTASEVTSTPAGNLASSDVQSALNELDTEKAISGGAEHDGFSDFVANEHIDWTSDQGATNIDTGNYDNANSLCSGTTTYLDGEGNCDDISTVYEPVLTDEASLYSTLSDVDQFYEPGDTLRTGAGASRPATCTTGEMWIDTDADTDGAFFMCVATNTWKEDDDDGIGDMVETEWDSDSDGYIDTNKGGTDTSSAMWTGVPVINSGTWSAETTLTHEKGGVEANVSSYTGLIGITAGVTAEIDTAAELESYAGLGAFANEYLDDADASTMRTTLGLAIDSDVQSYDANTTILGATIGASEVDADVATQAELDAVAALVDTDDEIITIINDSPSTQIGVPAGGTGAATLTDGGILLGSGTGAITALGVATNGQIPIGDGTTDPVLATITGTANEVTVTNGAGSITLSLPNDAGTDISADLEEESHASEHQDGGADEIAVTAGMMNTGTNASSSTFWRGDNTWAVPAGAGDVSKVGTPANHEFGIWTGDGTMEGVAVAGDNVLCTDADGEPEACSNLSDTSYEPADAAIAKTDEAETLSADWVNTANPWAVNEGGTGQSTAAGWPIGDTAFTDLAAGDTYTSFGDAADDTIDELLDAVDTAIGSLGGGHDAVTIGAASTGILDLATQEITLDVTPSSGNATLVQEEDALQVKYDATLSEGASGLTVAMPVTAANIGGISANLDDTDASVEWEDATALGS